MRTLSIQIDSRLYTAEVPLSATLRQFFAQAGLTIDSNSVLFDGQRVLAVKLEMAFRHHGAKLSTNVPEELMRHVPALTPESLLVSVDR